MLRPNEFCNLTEVVVSADDDEKSLKNKVRLASILGTWQSTLTDFKYIRKSWKANCEEERLLGVSLTGIFGNKLTGTIHNGLADLLVDMRKQAVSENKKEASALGIEASVAVTTVKPSGTVSQLTGVSSGIHPWYSEYYIRTVRADNKDPLTLFLKDFGVPSEPDIMKPDATTVFSFPVKSPTKAVVTEDMTAIEQLETWLMYQRHWCEHKPSVTINVRKDEWFEVGAFVYKYFDEMSGVSFLPYNEHTYQQAPYQEVDKDQYKDLLSAMPSAIAWSELANYEKEDNTVSMQTMACTGDVCEMVDIT